MKQLVLFQMNAEAQSLNITGKANLEKQSNLSSNITASNSRIDSEDESPVPFSWEYNEEMNYNGIYDEYEDFDVCSKSWH